MSRFARIDSVGVLKEFRGSLCTFAQKASTALEEANSEIHRTIMWLKQDQHRHWKTQVRLRTERLNQAKRELQSKENYERMSPTGKGSCIDEKRALAHAQEQLEEAQQKLVHVRRWVPILENETFTYQGLVRGLSNAVEVEIPNACAQIDRMIESLEAYMTLALSSEEPELLTKPPSEDKTPSEQIPSMIRKAATPAEGPPQNYPALRKRTPTPAVREQIEISRKTIPWLKRGPISKTSREAVAGIDVERTPVTAHDKIVVAKTDRHQRRIYLERTTPGSDGDSGWYIGMADIEETLGCEGIRSVDLLKIYPGLNEILALPRGYLVVLDGAALEAVVDPQDNVVWPVQQD